MSLDLLDTPLRVTWDLCPTGLEPLRDADLMQVAERLADAGLFYLLLDERPLLHPGLPACLEMLTASGCQVSLVLRGEDEELKRLRSLDKQVGLWVDAGPWLELPEGLNALDALFSRIEESGHRASLLWIPVRGKLLQIYPLLALCKRRNLPRFKLPNPKIGATSDPVGTARLLQVEDLAEFSRQLRKQPLPTLKTALEVHDLFLWELLFPQGGGERTEYGGCQAGNSLGHIAANADVWPCSSWPQPLGNLLQQDLATLWNAPRRHQVRSDVAAPLTDCAGCRDYAVCFGGCRGLVRSCRTDGGDRDLLCAGRR